MGHKFCQWLQEEELAKAQEGVADEEGWVTVTRHSKHNKALPYTQAHEARLKDKHKHKAKEKVGAQPLLHYYHKVSIYSHGYY